MNPEGVATGYHFEYRSGSSGPYTSTPTQSLSPQSSPVSVSAPLMSLQPGTKYQWQLVATHGTSGSVTVTQAGAGFQTTAVPTVRTGSSTHITEDSASVTGTVNPNGLSTTWSVSYGTSPSALSTTAHGGDAGAGTSAKPVSLRLGGLKPARRYYYRLTASNDDGASANTAVLSFVTIGPPKLSGLRITPDRFVSAVKHRPTITYTDTQSGTTTFTVQRLEAGVTRGGRCVAPPQQSRPGERSCTRRVPVTGRFTHHDAVGSNHLALPAKIGGSALPAGSYELLASPQGTGGVPGPSASAGFRVLAG